MNYYLVAPLLRKARHIGFATYGCESMLERGQIVTVQYGSRMIGGVVMQRVKRPSFNVKMIEPTVDAVILNQDLMQLADWFSDYYGLSKIESFPNMLPSGVHKKRRQASLSPNAISSKMEDLPSLTSDQRRVLKDITKTIQPVLLHGVTGSGKTRVYVEHIKQLLADGKSTILLVPEIALSGDIYTRLQASLKANIYHLHSRHTESQAHRLWRDIRSSSKPVVVVGPRSAVFAPVNDLGAIIIDECHDSSYKQETSPAYSALHVAGARCKIANAQLILASATPNVTEYFLAEHGKIQSLNMSQRVIASKGHEVSVISRLDKSNFSASRILSDTLMTSIEHSLQHKKLSLLFLNRRGHSPIVICNDCGWRAACTYCHSTLNYHAATGVIQCHICGHREKATINCPVCGSDDVVYGGVGTQKLETEVKKLFATSRVLRFDQDAAGANGEDQTLMVESIINGEVDIVIGTQMLGKGFDFGLLETVGIIDADTMLYMPDYRSNEVTFQTIAQAIGRNDRRGAGGRTIVQTATPDNYALRTALSEDYATFYRHELKMRQQSGYPPYSYLVKITARRQSDNQARTALAKIRTAAEQASLKVLGPAPAMHHARNKRIWNLILEAPRRQSLVEFCKNLKQSDVIVNFDPLHLL